MSDLTVFRDHCRAMTRQDAHKPGCPSRRTCGGCVSDADRLLFAMLAAEVDTYLVTDHTHTPEPEEEPLWP